MKPYLRALLAVLLGAGTLSVRAQTRAELDIQTYAGLTIAGEVGEVYSIEYVAGLTEPSESDWRCLEFVQLAASPYLWVDLSAPAAAKRLYRAVAMEAPTNMVFIPPGTFLMGSPDDEVGRWDNEGPQTEVTISRGFWMGIHEVTQGEYQAVTGDNPSWFNGDRTVDGGGDYGIDLNRAVESVSWFDATNYCAVLTQQERAAGRMVANCEYRLPTEAEWEYGCRGWTSTRFSYGDDPGYTNLNQYAWYDGNSDERTHAVGQKSANPWGLYDTHGNVWEWCRDRYREYTGGIAVDPQGPLTGSNQAVRGGLWGGVARSCRSAFRFVLLPDNWVNTVGFRVVLAPAQL